MPVRLLFLFLFCASAMSLHAQTEWNPLLGRTGGAADYRFAPRGGEAGAAEVRADGGWVLGLDARIGGRAIFFVPGLRWQSLNYAVQVETGPAGEPLFRDGDAQVLTIPLGVAYRLREAHTSFNLNLHAGVFYQLELSQSTVLGPDGRPSDWHPDSAYGLRLGAGLDLDWLTLHLNYFPRLGTPEVFSESGGFGPRNLAIGVRF